MISDRNSITLGVFTREEWDDVALTYTKTDSAGKVLSSRPFTPAETAYYAEQATLRTAAQATKTAGDATKAALVAKLKGGLATPAEQQAAIAALLGG